MRPLRTFLLATVALLVLVTGTVAHQHAPGANDHGSHCTACNLHMAPVPAPAVAPAPRPTVDLAPPVAPRPAPHRALPALAEAPKTSPPSA